MSIDDLRKQSQQMVTTEFNADAWHAMQARDEQLIADAVLHGYTGEEYIYKFRLQGNEVQGISVVGARELASQYGGIQSRIVASVDKENALFVFKSFEPLAVQAQMIPTLADEGDFYEVVMEVKDIKTGNSVQVRKKEYKEGVNRDGEPYSKPHYDVIAESKAYRNGVLNLIPQSVIKQFKERALKAGKASSERTKDQLIEACLGFAAKNGLSLNRDALKSLRYDEIMGMGMAAKGGLDGFKSAAVALDVMATKITDQSQAGDQADPEDTTEESKPRKRRRTKAEMDAARAAEREQHEQGQQQEPSGPPRQEPRQAASELDPRPEPADGNGAADMGFE